MLQIIAGTDRIGAKSLEVANWLQQTYLRAEVRSEVLSLQEVGLQKIDQPYHGSDQNASLKAAVQRVNQARGLVFVVPEYNGGLPGALKYFIDHWSYPLSFEFRPVAFVGIGNRWGGLRPVEQLQGILGYRNAYQLPHRVFIQNIGKVFVGDGNCHDPSVAELLEQQCRVFPRFIEALGSQKLDATSRIAQ